MNSASRANAFFHAAETAVDAPGLAMLPNDVLPNIFSRLPTSELFALASVSGQMQHMVRAQLGDATRRELLRLTPTPAGDFVEPLCALLSAGAQHIAEEDWTKYLQSAGDAGISPLLLQALLLSLATEDAALRKHPDTLAAASQKKYSSLINGWGCVVRVCAAGMKQLMRLEARRNPGDAQPVQLKNSRGWQYLVELYQPLFPVSQLRLLLSVRPQALDREGNRRAFDGLVANHLANMLESNNFFEISARVLKEPEICAAYFKLLSDACAVAPPGSDITYFQKICGKRAGGLVSGHWKNDTPEHCNFVLRLLAYETLANLARDSNGGTRWSNAIWSHVRPDYLSHLEFEDFSETMKDCINREMRLEDAVSLWITENLVGSRCVIS